jgi:hypothetical protein
VADGEERTHVAIFAVVKVDRRFQGEVVMGCEKDRVCFLAVE